ncbi:MAG: type II toxin-antitoxin system prevent-host-death family antitoxin [Anaerolineaceae bacterium]|nr:type II toxin-antitoxin system prevent-host-death family antitoxin [Anaerolineaceae bacterium]
MEMTTATATEMQNNFGRYLNYVIDGNEVILTKNGKEVARLIPRKSVVASLTDSLTGILKNETDAEDEREWELTRKYAGVH